jgi:hypothetical protein
MARGFVKRLVELAHCRIYTLAKKTIDGFRYINNCELGYRFFLWKEIAKHVIDYSVFINGRFFPLGTPNSHPDSGEVLAFQSGNNGIHPFVSSRASAPSQANFAQGQVEVIMYYQEVAQGNVMLVHQASYGFATEIYKCPWLGQQQLLTSYLADAYFSPALPVVKADRMKPGEVIQTPKANIMAIVGINPARIAQTNDEFHK